MVICKVVGDNSWDFSPIYEEVPNAPSVEEIVEVLKVSSRQLNRAEDFITQHKCDALIKRLGG